MTEEERWQWEERLKPSISQSDAVAAILDRVEFLEAKLRDAPHHCGTIMRDGNHKRCLGCGDVWPIDSPGVAREDAAKAILDRVEALEAELAAARAVPPAVVPSVWHGGRGEPCPMCGSANTVRATPDAYRCFNCGNAFGDHDEEDTDD